VELWHDVILAGTALCVWGGVLAHYWPDLRIWWLRGWIARETRTLKRRHRRLVRRSRVLRNHIDDLGKSGRW